MSEIRANSITNVAGTGAPNFPNGLSGNGSALTNLPAPTTAQVGTATAGLAWGDLGSYAFFRNNTTTAILAGGTLVASGSNLRSAGVSTSASGAATLLSGNPSPTGTWRAMGNTEYNATGPVTSATLWLRIA